MNGPLVVLRSMIRKRRGGGLLNLPLSLDSAIRVVSSLPSGLLI